MHTIQGELHAGGAGSLNCRRLNARVTRGRVARPSIVLFECSREFGHAVTRDTLIKPIAQLAPGFNTLVRMSFSITQRLDVPTVAAQPPQRFPRPHEIGHVVTRDTRINSIVEASISFSGIRMHVMLDCLTRFTFRP